MTPERRMPYVATKGGWIQTSVTVSDMNIAMWTQQKQDLFIEAVAATAQVSQHARSGWVCCASTRVMTQIDRRCICRMCACCLSRKSVVGDCCRLLQKFLSKFARKPANMRKILFGISKVRLLTT